VQSSRRAGSQYDLVKDAGLIGTKKARQRNQRLQATTIPFKAKNDVQMNVTWRDFGGSVLIVCSDRFDSPHPLVLIIVSLEIAEEKGPSWYLADDYKP
jgi:hypothetical protein